MKELMSDTGKSILNLFGYHLASKMENKTFFKMGKASKQIFVDYDNLRKYC